jgi:two-component sensor histidine kinase
MLSDVMGSSARVRLARAGTFGDVPAERATALVLVLTELVQNALEHAFPQGRSGRVDLTAVRRRGELVVRVIDDGVGLPADFDAESAEWLGMQIVRTLVSAELNGTVAFEPGAQAGASAGTVATLTMPLGRRPRVGG